MAIEIVRSHENPAHLVLLGLSKEMEHEVFEMTEPILRSLSPVEMVTLSKIVNGISIRSSLKVGDKIVIPFGDYRLNLSTINNHRDVDENTPTFAHIVSDLFIYPVPFTLDLIRDWLNQLSKEWREGITAAKNWLDEMNQKQDDLLKQDLSDEEYLRQFKELTNNVMYICGPHGARWSYNAAASQRRGEAEFNISEKTRKATEAKAKQQKVNRYNFTRSIVESLGSDNQKERYKASLLPNTEIAEMLHEHILGELFDRRITAHYSMKNEHAKITASEFEVYKKFEKAIKNQDYIIYLDAVTITYFDSQKTQSVARVCIEDDNGSWESTEVYRL